MKPAMMTPDALAALDRAGFSRRAFLKGAGAMIVTFSMAGTAKKLDAQSSTATDSRITATEQVDSWIVISQDETVTGYAGQCDFGQGFRTVQYQLIADELSVPLDRVKLILCDTALTPDQGVSSGSQGHPTQFGASALRQALATARETLFKMASDQLGVAVDQLTVQDGVISMKSDASRRMTYGKL